VKTAGEKAWEDRRVIRTRASADRAWRAWADPAAIQGWFADEAAGSAEPGSVLIHRFPAMGFEIPHEVVESEPGERLVLRIRFPGRPPVTQEITVRSEGGETVIELVNAGFGEEEWDGQFDGIDSGWRLALAQLRHYLEHYWGRRRHVWLALRPARIEWDRVALLFRDPDGLSQWLTDPAAAAAVAGGAGSAVSMVIRDGSRLTGRVLADSRRELLLSWKERDATLELKAFSAGPSAAMVGLRMSSWAEVAPDRTVTQAWLDVAADRLATSLADRG
jgi:uncharacterized protein YndB with AHSA1/START domain